MRLLCAFLLPALAAAQPDPAQVLERLRRTVLDNAARIPNYTCVETLERQTYRSRFAWVDGTRNYRPPSCVALASERKRKGYELIPASMDRLRLDVRVGRTAEMYSWVGADQFEDRDLDEVAGRFGPLGFKPLATGPFGALLLSVFQGDAPELRFVERTSLDGRTVFAYSFDVPLEKSHNYLRMGGGSKIVTAYSGAFYVDPQTAELVRLVQRESGLPPDSSYCEVATTLDYGHVRLGDADFLLPQIARQRFVQLPGLETENTVTFNSCREFRAESKLETGERPVVSGRGRPAPARVDLPSGLPFTMELTAPLDSDTAAAGDRFAARLSKPIVGRDRQVLAPAGAVVEGRLQMVEIIDAERAVRFVFRPDTMVIDGAARPFEATGKTDAEYRRRTARGVSIGELPRFVNRGLGGFRFAGRRKTLQPGFKMEWVTGAPE